jgi:hypothetical protein
VDALAGLITGRSGRAEPRARMGVYLSGLVARLVRKNGWMRAEYADPVSPGWDAAAAAHRELGC